MIRTSTADTRPAYRLLPLVLGLALTVSACNTIEGAGEDVQATGDAISDTARETKEEITD